MRASARNGRWPPIGTTNRFTSMCGRSLGTMANEEHVAILKENVVAWQKNLSNLSNFKAVDLSGADLRG
jgi:hypothetical protein